MPYSYSHKPLYNVLSRTELSNLTETSLTTVVQKQLNIFFLRELCFSNHMLHGSAQVSAFRLYIRSIYKQRI